MYMYIYACVFCFIFIFKSSLNVESSHMCNIHRIVKETHQIMLYTCEILVQMFSNLVPNVHLCDHVFLNKSYVCLIFVFTGMFIYSFKVFWLLTIKINDCFIMPLLYLYHLITWHWQVSVFFINYYYYIY